MTTAALSDYAENAMLDHLLGGGDYTAAATLYASLHSGALNDAGAGTEFSAGNYARKAVTNNNTNFPAASSRTKLLHILTEFLQASAAWGTVASWGLWEASTSGNLLVRCDPAAAVVGTGDIPKFAVDALSIVAAAGAFSDYAAHKLLDLFFSGAAFTRPATVYLAAFVAGAEVTGNNYSRLAITNNNTNFPAASAGAKFLHTNQTMAAPSGSWGTLDEFRLYDASTAGNHLVTITPTTPKLVGVDAPARFLADTITFSLT